MPASFIAIWMARAGSSPHSCNRTRWCASHVDPYPAISAHICAEIAGYGSTCEAYHRVRLQECGEEPARAIQMAMKEAGISASDVHYVNLHGTATELNDRIETR